jgi:primosomal protein N' (replication factor Y)
MNFIRVALDVPLDTLFDYSVAEAVAVGQRVRVPFGRKECLGIVLAVAETSELPPEKIKPVLQVLSDVPPLPAELLTLLRFCSEYYQHPLGMTVLSALPARLRSSTPLTVKPSVFYSLTTAGLALDLTEFPKRRAVQLKILNLLNNQQLTKETLREISASAPAAIKELIDSGWVETKSAEAITPNTESSLAALSANGLQAQNFARFNELHALTQAQESVIRAVAGAQGFQCFLLHGITGSGKTEVYVHLMQQVLQQGKQVLLLVPEINLTPQLEHYFHTRFPDTELASLHSGLNDGERAKKWLRAQAGQARIVLGTRLSVFTPLPQLGLILVDEEHDASFKQQDGLRYSARDVAIFRANQCGVPIVLGSATPSLESYFNAHSGRYQLLKLTERASAQAQLPQVRCLNINQVPLSDGISPALLAAISERLLRKEQSLIFINRRGYAPVLMCTACGWVSNCTHCAGKLVLHLKDRRLRCHHCGDQQRVPRACPSCGNADLQPVGTGTQRIEETLQAQFPEARILRVDRDSTRNKNAWKAMREQIEANEVDILIGTQMLAKGHDFPNLTLVGVLNPDGALYSADFRASERLFAQLAQVSGRAGRADKAGEVLVQTAFPDHPLYRALIAHDYDLWAKTLLSEREQAGFPPFVFQLLLRAESLQENEVYSFLKQAREAAVQLAFEVEIYGVVAASMPKRANHVRAQLLIQSQSRKGLQQFLRAWRPYLAQIPAKKLRWSLDIDPLEF